MSNRASIVRTTFEDYNGKSYGWRAYDDYAKTYCNIHQSPMPDDDLEFLALVMEDEDSILEDILDFIREESGGIYIDDQWYNWSELKSMMKKINKE